MFTVYLYVSLFFIAPFEGEGRLRILSIGKSDRRKGAEIQSRQGEMKQNFIERKNILITEKKQSLLITTDI